jgi:hypothetical protein
MADGNALIGLRIRKKFFKKWFNGTIDGFRAEEAERCAKDKEPVCCCTPPLSHAPGSAVRPASATGT